MSATIRLEGKAPGVNQGDRKCADCGYSKLAHYKIHAAHAVANGHAACDEFRVQEAAAGQSGAAMVAPDGVQPGDGAKVVGDKAKGKGKA